MPERKTLYIPEDKLGVFNEFEKKASDLDMSFSELFIDTLPHVMKAMDKTEYQGEEITLLLKEKGEDFEFPRLKQIKFIGEKLIETDLMYTADDSPIQLKPLDSVKNWTQLRHQYVFYKTKKNKILVYIKLLHIEFNNYEPEFGTSDPDDFIVLEEELKYKTYDSEDLRTMAAEIYDIPPYCMDKLILEFTEIEELDI